MVEVITIIGLIAIGVLFLAILAMYRIVPASQAHYVVSPEKTFVVSPDLEVRGDKGSRWYFLIPIIRTIRKLDITIQELVVPQETYEKNQARYNVTSSIKYRIRNVKTSAETFVNHTELKKQLTEVVRASVRAITVKYDVIEARASKQKMSMEIKAEIEDDLNRWGLELINFQLIDFQDTESSKIISHISKRREVEIEARTREENAEKKKTARMKEAEAEEKAKEREIAKDKVIGEREQEMDKAIADQKKIAEEAKFEVIRVQQVKQAEIDKEKAIVKAEEDKATEVIHKEQKRLEGEGDKLRDMEKAKGEAAPIREKGFAEAEAKDKLQLALNKFEDKAIRALVAEKIVAKDEAIGIATAQALEKADLKVFSGGESGKTGFNLGELVTSTSVGNMGAADALLNKTARPNDLGLSILGLKAIQEEQEGKDQKKGKKTDKSS